MTPRPMDEPAGWAGVALAVVEFAREAMRKYGKGSRLMDKDDDHAS